MEREKVERTIPVKSGGKATSKATSKAMRKAHSEKDNKQIINNGTIAREFRRFLAT